MCLECDTVEVDWAGRNVKRVGGGVCEKGRSLSELLREARRVTIGGEEPRLCGVGLDWSAECVRVCALFLGF